MSYTRKDFQIWLESLPPDEPFVPKGACPLSVYLHYSSLWLAASEDTELADKIDEATDEEWHRITPMDVLAIIYRLAAGPEEKEKEPPFP